MIDDVHKQAMMNRVFLASRQLVSKEGSIVALRPAFPEAVCGAGAPRGRAGRGLQHLRGRGRRGRGLDLLRQVRLHRRPAAWQWGRRMCLKKCCDALKREKVKARTSGATKIGWKKHG